MGQGARVQKSVTGKEFGKLTHEQFSSLVARLPEVRGQMKELPELMQKKKDRLHELLGPENYSWGNIYALPFLNQMAWLFVLLGLHIPLHEAALSNDPQETVLRWTDANSALDTWYEARENDIEWKHLMWLTVVLQRNILSIMLYHQSIGALVESVRTRQATSEGSIDIQLPKARLLVRGQVDLAALRSR